MAHTLSWHVPAQILYLELSGEPTVQELEDINRAIVEIVEGDNKRINILLEANNLRAGYKTADLLRDTQAYMNHNRVDSIFIVAESKLIRLVTLMGFSLCRAKFVQFENREKAETYLKHRGLVVKPS